MAVFREAYLLTGKKDAAQVGACVFDGNLMIPLRAAESENYITEFVCADRALLGSMKRLLLAQSMGEQQLMLPSSIWEQAL